MYMLQCLSWSNQCSLSSCSHMLYANLQLTASSYWKIRNWKVQSLIRIISNSFRSVQLSNECVNEIKPHPCLGHTLPKLWMPYPRDPSPGVSADAGFMQAPSRRLDMDFTKSCQFANMTPMESLQMIEQLWRSLVLPSEDNGIVRFLCNATLSWIFIVGVRPSP